MKKKGEEEESLGVFKIVLKGLIHNHVNIFLVFVVENKKPKFELR
jgi:hypothetical protein